MNTQTLITQSKIKNLGVTLESLYNREKQINVHFSDTPHVFNLVLIGRDGEPDFCLSSFGANIYARTDKGYNRQKYTSLEGIQKAVEKLAAKKLIYSGAVSYSLSDDVYTF